MLFATPKKMPLRSSDHMPVFYFIFRFDPELWESNNHLFVNLLKKYPAFVAFVADRQNETEKRKEKQKPVFWQLIRIPGTQTDRFRPLTH